MAREINKLTARKVATLSKPGRHADGGGLYLVVDASGGKRWVMLYRLPGRRREMGLGALSAVPLVKARELAAELRGKIQSGVDPVVERQAAKEATSAVPVAEITFADVAVTYMADHEATWRNAKHRSQWRQTLEVQAAKLWSMPVAKIGTDEVLAVLRPMWLKKPETATRLRGRIERVLSAAIVGRHRSTDNPALWRGHLDAVLPRPGKLKRGHHPAMPYANVPAFYASLCLKDGYSAIALRIAILTAARSGEVRGMPWGEVDLATALWTVPAARMKANRIHRVPLSAPVVALLQEIRPEKPASRDLVMPSRAETPLSDMALTMLLRKAGQGEYTAHGFRSSFRDWVDEATSVPGEIAEAALAHLTGDETERAYRRGDALEKRRTLMDQWADFVLSDVRSMNVSSSA